MRVKIVTFLTIVVLLACVVMCQWQFQGEEREDPLGRELLYLPTPEALRLLSLGNQGLMADILFLWSIQYSTQFQPTEKILYLETMFELITNLDPLYFDAYRIGAMFMINEISVDKDKRKSKAKALYDKGIAADPTNWRLASLAAWDFKITFGDDELAAKYMGIAASQPTAPPLIKRVHARWCDKGKLWTLADSFRYWQKLVAEADNENDLFAARSNLYDVVVQIDRQRIEPLLQRYKKHTGSCASSWHELVAAGLIAAPPVDYFGDEYGLDAEKCALYPFKRVTKHR